jgi:hypothetical protein
VEKRLFWNKVKVGSQSPSRARAVGGVRGDGERTRAGQPVEKVKSILTRVLEYSRGARQSFVFSAIIVGGPKKLTLPRLRGPRRRVPGQRVGSMRRRWMRDWRVGRSLYKVRAA